MVGFLAEGPRTRDAILSRLGIGLRTFYRELDLLKRCGVKVRYRAKQYTLFATAVQAEGRLPFPDPQLSFAEMAQLAACPCDAGAAARPATRVRDQSAYAGKDSAKAEEEREGPELLIHPLEKPSDRPQGALLRRDASSPWP